MHLGPNNRCGENNFQFHRWWFYKKIQLRNIHMYKFIMMMTSHQISIIRRKKLHESLDDFDFDEVNDDDNVTYQKKVLELTQKWKVSSIAIILQFVLDPNQVYLYLYVTWLLCGALTFFDFLLCLDGKGSPASWLNLNLSI